LSRVDNVFGRHLLVAVDAAGYGTGTDQEHIAVQSGLPAVLDAAAARANLRRDRWLTQQAGDGELAVLPRDEPEPIVVDQYVRYLDEALAAYNANPASRRKLRLRMAIHFGTAMPADNGYAGQGVVAVSRLVDSAAVKDALAAAPQACLAVILSRQVFDDVVRQGHVSVQPTDFAKVSVRVKEFQDEAWVKVVGVPLHASVPSNKPADDKPPASRAEPEDNRVAFGEGGPVSGPYGTFSAAGAKGGFGFTGGGGDFGSRFAYYVRGVQQRISENWLKYEVDPRITNAQRVYVIFDIARDGHPSNVRVEQSSGVPSLDVSASRAVQRVDSFGALPSEYSGNKVSVEFWFDYKR